jgi:hypothetical protein
MNVLSTDNYYIKNINEKRRDYQRQYREAHKEKLSQYGHEYRQRNKAKIQEYRKKYNKQKTDYWIKYYNTNKSYLQEYHRKRYQEIIKDKPVKQKLVKEKIGVPTNLLRLKINDPTLTPQQRWEIQKQRRNYYMKRKLSKIYDNTKKYLKTNQDNI